MDKAVIDIIQSKSYAHRALICAALSETPCKVNYSSKSDDVEATKECLKVLKNDGVIMDCRESGSTLRFILPIMSALGRDALYITKGRLGDRPLSPLKEEMESHGCRISGGRARPLEVKGQLHSGTFVLPGNVTSQFVSGLLFALPLVEGDSRIIVEGKLESAAYVRMTVDVIEQFGIKLSEKYDDERLSFDIKGGQKYHGASEYTVEGDWSQAAFWLAYGAIGDRPVEVRGLKERSLQGDKKILEILRSFGARIEIIGSSVIAYPSDLRGVDVDISEIPDLAPVIALVGAVAKGTTNIKNGKRLRLKESDRISSIRKCLDDLGADVSEGQDSLTIEGTGGKKLKGGIAETANDHRIVMMAAVASCACSDKVIVEESTAVKKSYPDFFEVMKKAGLGDNVEQR